MNTESATNVLTRQWRIATYSKTVTPRNRMPETGASGSVGAPLEQSEGATRQQVPPYGLPSHLFRFALELAFAPRWRGRCFLLLIIAARSSLPKSKTKRVSGLQAPGLCVPPPARSGCLNRVEIPAEFANWTLYRRYAFVSAGFSD
jgi:hypothetical protein